MAAKRRALAERRRSVGLSQERLAETLCVEPSTVGRWERGETAPQPWFRPKLAQALARVGRRTPRLAHRYRCS